MSNKQNPFEVSDKKQKKLKSSSSLGKTTSKQKESNSTMDWL